MAIDTTESYQEFTADGNTAYFTFNFNYVDSSEIVVGMRTGDNAYETVQPEYYQVIQNASENGGQVRFISNPSGSEIVDNPPASGTIVRIERRSPETSDATWQVGLEMSQLVGLFDTLFRLVQENIGRFDNTIETFATQHGVKLYELLAEHTDKLLYWNNDTKTLTPTDFPRQDIVRSVGGLFFRIKVDNSTNTPYLEWSQNGIDNWYGINLEAVANQASEALEKAGQGITTATQAKQTADEAKSIAQNAATNAENAVRTATEATNVANAAVATANEAKNTADSASAKATAAEATANTALGAVAGKQDQLTAGDNIIISGNVISATGGTGTDDYTRLLNKPEINGNVLTGNKTASQLGFATVATSGSYNDLSDKPTIPTVNNPTITFTQGGVTKGSFTLNQATDDTIALDAGGGSSVVIDNSTITKNADQEIQAVAVIDQNTGIAKTWTGTIAEYSAIATKDPETEYIITDDIGGSAIEIGEITEALNNKVDKGHQVVEFQAPTAENGYTWYRKYADGWVEQGGVFNNSTNLITFPVAMANTKYTCVSGSLSDDGNAVYNIQFYSITTTGLLARNLGSNTGWTGQSYPSGWWQVSGMSAQ